MRVAVRVKWIPAVETQSMADDSSAYKASVVMDPTRVAVFGSALWSSRHTSQVGEQDRNSLRS